MVLPGASAFAVDLSLIRRSNRYDRESLEIMICLFAFCQSEACLDRSVSLVREGENSTYFPLFSVSSQTLSVVDGFYSNGIRNTGNFVRSTGIYVWICVFCIPVKFGFTRVRISHTVLCVYVCFFFLLLVALRLFIDNYLMF